MVYSKEFLELKIPSEVRFLLYIVVLLVFSVFVFLFFGKIDEVIKTDGIVRTEENVSTVKNVIAGRIISKAYKPGQRVSKGDLLYEIDPSIFQSQHRNLISEKENLENRIKGNDALLRSFTKNKNLVEKADEVAWTRFESYRTNLEKLKIQKNISYEALLDEQKQPLSLRNEKTIRQRKMEYEYNKTNFESFSADFIKSLNQEKEELSISYSKNIEEIKKLESQYEYLKIYSPMDGYVQENSSLNTGDYLEAGAAVLNIIPNDEKNFRVELHILPKDMGKIKPGLKVKYRLSAFPFFEYRGAEGVITSVDPDIRNSSSGKGGLFYVVYADLDRVLFTNRHGESFPVRSGLETNCRIVLETQTVISYVLRKIDFWY